MEVAQSLIFPGDVFGFTDPNVIRPENRPLGIAYGNYGIALFPGRRDPERRMVECRGRDHIPGFVGCSLLPDDPRLGRKPGNGSGFVEAFLILVFEFFAEGIIRRYVDLDTPGT